MGWQLYRATYELLSPLHIGYHKISNVQRTRYYIPARNVWAALTERMTHSGFNAQDAPEGDYQRIGGWLRMHIAFTYFFLVDDKRLLYPHYGEFDGLRYGPLSQAEFERRFLSAHVTTALDPATSSAAEGTLHEVEFIAPYDDQGRRTRVSGWLLLDDDALQYGEAQWHAWLSRLWVGGERRYGFGRLRGTIESLEESQLSDGYAVDVSGVRPRVTVARGKPLLAHTVTRGVRASGMIEPLVGRETGKDSGSFGAALTRGLVCWVPGSVLEQEQQLCVDETGVWKIAS